MFLWRFPWIRQHWRFDRNTQFQNGEYLEQADGTLDGDVCS